MATEKDITEQRETNEELLGEKIREALEVKKSLPIGDARRSQLTDTIQHLMDSWTDLHIQTLKAGLDSAQLAAALAKITAAGQDLNTEAAKMKDATSYMNNANAVIGAATKVTNILKNGG